MKHAWKRVSSGKYVDLNNLQIDDLDIDDVVVSLANIIRFSGHHKDEEPLRVDQHSNLVLYLAEGEGDHELSLACLVHDFEEYLIGDVVTPVKKAMGDAWHKFYQPIGDIVQTKFFGKTFGEELEQRVKMYDLMALDIERRSMWSSQRGKDKWPPYPTHMSLVEKSDLFNWAKEDKPNLKAKWEDLYAKVYG
jgi:hypothetical protein